MQEITADEAIELLHPDSMMELLKEFVEYDCTAEGEPKKDAIKEACIMACKAIAFKRYFDELYGIGLDVENWHLNGDPESFDSFYEEAIDEGDDLFPNETCYRYPF